MSNSILRSALVAPMLMFAVGCSSADDGGDAETPDLRPAPPLNTAVCEATHRPLPTPNAKAYRFFASDQEAAAHATDYFPQQRRKAPLPAGHALQPKAEAVVAELYPTFRKLYPAETQGLDTPPRVLMIDDQTGNAFVIRDVRVEPNVYPWYMAFHTGALDASHDELLGLVAHELSHLVLRNGSPAVEGGYRRSYLVSGDEVGTFGAYQSNNAAVQKRASELGELRARVGIIGISELGGIPIWPNAGTPPIYKEVFTRVYDKYKPQSPNPSACSSFDAKLDEMKNMLEAHVNLIELTVTLDEGMRAAIESKVAPMRKDLLECLPRLQLTFAALLKSPDALERAADTKYGGKDFMAELWELASLRQKALAELEAKTDLPLDALRVYESEEDADNISAYVMRELGKDPRSVANFLLHQRDAAYANECLAKVKGGSTPFFGALRDDHPALCWRYWNVDRFARTADVSCRD